MTEAAYQAARKLMAQINYLRGMITTAKHDVVKWENIVYELRSKGQSSLKAEKVRDRTHLKLKKLQDRFTGIVFPDPNLIENAEPKHSHCTICGKDLPIGEFTCEECLQTFYPEQRSDKVKAKEKEAKKLGGNE